MKTTLLLICFSLLLAIGCAQTQTMDVSSEQKLKSPEQGKAQIVFMRVSRISRAVGCELFEINNDEGLKYIGSIARHNKIAFSTSPGEKIFMSASPTPYFKADFMRANVKEGKTYFSMVVPNWGTGGFWLQPFRNDETADFNYRMMAFHQWVSNTKLLIKNAERADKFFQEKASHYEELYEKFWKRWEKKTPAEKQKYTINEEDWINLERID